MDLLTPPIPPALCLVSGREQVGEAGELFYPGMQGQQRVSWAQTTAGMGLLSPVQCRGLCNNFTFPGMRNPIHFHEAHA